MTPLTTGGALALELLAVDGRCEADTNEDGDCGRTGCPFCGTFFFGGLTQELADKLKTLPRTPGQLIIVDELPSKKLPLMHRHFGGVKTQATHDRLEKLLDRVKGLMKDGQWRILRDIQRACGGTEASCSARLRDLRKVGFGSHTVHREEIFPGLYMYQLVFNPKEAEGRAQAYYFKKHPPQKWRCFYCGYKAPDRGTFGMHLKVHLETGD